MSHFFQPTLSHWFGHAARPAIAASTTQSSPWSSLVSHIRAHTWAKHIAVRHTHAATPDTQSLEQYATFWVTQPLTRQIRCDAGVLWLTFDHDARDVVLEAGQTHFCQSDARLSIHALQQGSFLIV